MSLHFVNPEASPVLQYPASPSFLSPLSEEFPLLGPPWVVTSPPSSSTILVTETFDSEVFEVPNPGRTIQSPSPLALEPPGSPDVEDNLQLLDILGNPLVGPTLPPWRVAALSGAPSSNTFGPSTCSLPTTPVRRTPTPDSPINYEAAVLRVAEYEELATRSPSPPLRFPTVAPTPPEPWDNLCPDADSNPHQYLAIHTPTGEEWTPYQGEIFSIPAAGNLLCHPPDFPSVFPFFTTLYHHQAFSPAPSVVVGLPAGAHPTIKACAQAIRIEPSPDIPLGYIRFSFKQGIKEAFTPIPPFCREAYRGHLVLLDHFDFLDGRSISTYGSLQFEGQHIFVHRQYYHFEDILRYWPHLGSFILTPRTPFDPFGHIPVTLDDTPL